MDVFNTFVRDLKKLPAEERDKIIEEKVIQALKDMVKLETYQGFSADLAAALSLLAATLIRGLPVSTTHTKTTAIMGVGAARRIRSVNWGVVREMVLAWVLTFPGCGLLGYLVTRLFIRLFV